MANKHPSTKSVIVTIIAVILVLAVAGYGLGVMNMKKEEPAETPAPEQTTTVEEPTSNVTTDAAQAPKATESAPSATSTLLAPRADDVILGQADAPVTIVEYSSLSCPHCAHFHNEDLAKLEEKYIDTGKAKLVIRNFPLNAPALKGALLVSCVKPEDKPKFVKVLFSMQEKWAFSNSYLDSLKQIAAVGGVSEEAFTACMNDKAKEDTIIKEVEEATKALNITGTPTFFINGSKFEGHPDAEGMGEAVERAQSQ